MIEPAENDLDMKFPLINHWLEGVRRAMNDLEIYVSFFGSFDAVISRLKASYCSVLNRRKWPK